ncbi:hypothetical protein [Motiliproteus sp. SC1-56]|uniref:hypothetical protein n=1 Tax=Motiliproteus sp. SC1-56 TaxID=2799565 RepID=UPI001F5DF939|nr:hypothetical protein [Motiliproteus sp. SC1-56]
MNRLKPFFRELGQEVFTVSVTLFRLMIPVIIVVKILEELGGVELLARLLGPVMALVGLPDSLGLVWAATLVTNIYAGMLIFFTQSDPASLSVAQVTVLGGLMLMAHGLPVEARIAQKAGVRLRATLLLRIGGGLLFAWLLHRIYGLGGWLEQPNTLLWQPAPVDPSLAGWARAQLESLLMIQVVIIVLLSALKLLRLLGVERLMQWLLQPLLRVLGIGPQATMLTIIGITLGLSFGGGLLIKEAQAGHIRARDVFCAMALLGLCHSLIEDTLLILLLGAHISGVLWLRLGYSLLLVALLSRWIDRRSPAFKARHLLYPPPASSSATHPTRPRRHAGD